MDDLAGLLAISIVTLLLIVTVVTTLAFALSAFACDRLGHKSVSRFLAAGAWLFGAFSGTGASVRSSPNGHPDEHRTRGLSPVRGQLARGLTGRLHQRPPRRPASSASSRAAL